MGKVYLDMYGVQGRVGNKTYYRSNGETYVREIVSPKNPKTDAQTTQRVFVKAVGNTYSELKEICNHSYEGYNTGAECSNYFRSVNLRYLRDRAATLQESGQSLSQFFQFTPLQSKKWTPFAAIISEGHLPVVAVGIDAVNYGSPVPMLWQEPNACSHVLLFALKGDSELNSCLPVRSRSLFAIINER